MGSVEKPFEDVLPEEYLQHPIWEMALSNSDMTTGWDESWRKPVVGATNLDDKSVGYFLGFRVENTSLIANALFYSKSIFPSSSDGTFEGDWIGQIFIWLDGRWQDLLRISEGVLSFPMVFEAIPSIRHVKEVKFILEEAQDDRANRIA